MKEILKKTLERSWLLISETTDTWNVIAYEDKTTSDIRKNYVFSWITICIIIVFVCNFLYATEHRFQSGIIEAIITTLSLFGGYFLAKNICFWFLKKQIADADENKCETVVAYSFTTIYILFIITTVFPSLFFLHILSVHCAYLVWEACQSVLTIDEEDRGNVVIVFAAAIVFSPFLINKIIHFMLPNV